MTTKDLYFLGGVSTEYSSRKELLFGDSEVDKFDKFYVAVEILEDVLELTRLFTLDIYVMQCH